MRPTSFFLLCTLLLPSARASYFIGAEIRYVPTGTDLYSYTVEVDVYSDLNSSLDRPEISLDLGDGTVNIVPRFLIQDFQTPELCWMVRLSTYRTTHTYAASGTYTMKFVDGNRGSGILNIPNSIAQSICVEALLVIDPLLGVHHSITFDSMQIVIRRNWNTLIHEPAPTDTDGDSLTFELVAPRGDGCQPILGYQFPVGVNYTWLDPATGTLLWDYPTANGDWSLAIRGSAYRNGQLIGQVTRDMSICIAGFIAGIGESTSVTDFNICPTISGTQVMIENRSNNSVVVEFVSVTGALINSATVTTGQHEHSLAQFAPGLYIATFRSANGTLLHSARMVRQ